MIRTNLTKVILLGVWGLVMSAAFISCADDHFDIPEGDGADGIATESLWSLLSSNPELSNFASIVEKTPAFKDEKHKIEGYTFKDILNGNQVLTLFAPDNTAFTKADVEEYEELLLVSPYDAFLRLIGNHLARNRYVASGMNPQGKAERLIFLNNKKGTFDREAKTIKDIPLTKSNLSATNGVMHIVSAQIPFAYNIYEYIRANKGYTHLNDWINRHDTLYFNSNLSAVAGTDPETGEPIYVDSVYTRFNSLYYYSYQPNAIEWAMPHKGLNANIEQEDSTWAMVLPTDAAWEEAAEQMRPWYNYADNYFDMSKLDDLPKDNSTAKANMLLEVTNDLQEDAIAMDIVSPLAFNIRMQRRTPEQPDFWTVESFLKYKISKLFNTRVDTFLIDKEGTEDVRKLLFEDKAPVYVSNGLVYSVESNMASYTDAGLWRVYFGCDHHDVKRCARLVVRELKRLCDAPLSQRTLDAARRQMKGQLGIAWDNPESVAIGMAKRFLHYGTTLTMAQQMERLDALTPDILWQTAQDILLPDGMTMLAFTETASPSDPHQ